MIGAWMLDECFSYSPRSSKHAENAPANALRRVVHYDGGFVIDYISETRLLTMAALRPLHNLCMCTEAVKVGQMLYCLHKQRQPSMRYKLTVCFALLNGLLQCGKCYVVLT